MKTFFITLSSFLSLISAAPLTVVRSRTLQSRDYNNTGSCPRSFAPNSYETPSMIVPVSAFNPNQSYGPSSSGIFTPGDMSSIFNFEIPASRNGSNCTLEFIFPLQEQFSNDSFALYSGPGSFTFSGFAVGSGAVANTTFNTQPTAGSYLSLPPIHMEPGNAYTINLGLCVAGTVAGITSTNDTTFVYPQDDTGSCPMGVYITYA